MRSTLQDWVMELTLMQQGVLLGAMRGADGVPKYNATKYLLRWYRRCTLMVAIEGEHAQDGVLKDPFTKGGGSYLGQCPMSVSPLPFRVSEVGLEFHWEGSMIPIVDDFIKSLDGLPHHFVQHLRNAIQVVGYKHPDPRIRKWWHDLYLRLVSDEHLLPESCAEMDRRLGDNYEAWRARCDDATAM